MLREGSTNATKVRDLDLTHHCRNLESNVVEL
jgi:hypothetical protein